ncbi:MAG: CPBP family intramembrane metalloprotease [Cyclobacteriaceae bacterium]|nr:CPBP family intramembrane metalloprotease [Cyclobacteriaceae bacterium]
MKEQRQLIYFLLLNFALGILISLIVMRTGGHDSEYIGIGYVSMFIPAISVLIMKLFFKAEVGTIDWNKFPIKWVPVALFLIPLAIHAICIPLDAFLNNGTIPWQSWLHADTDGLYHSPPERNWGTLTSSGLVLRILLNMVIGLAILTILVFFEEIGWRVWMFSRLMKSFDIKKTILIGAIIWGAWHIPFDISGIHYIEGIPTHQMVVMNLLGYIGAGVFIGWLWVKSQSIWIICLTHASLNNWGQYAFKYIEDAQNVTLLHTGVNCALLILGVIVWILIKTKPFKM